MSRLYESSRRYCVLTKVSTSGALLKVLRFNDVCTAATKLIFDKQGAVWMTPLTGPYNINPLLIKLSSEGALIKAIGWYSPKPSLSALAVDEIGSIWVTGRMSGDVFLAKFSTDGELLHALLWGGGWKMIPDMIW